jgi:hypothetical protein
MKVSEDQEDSLQAIGGSAIEPGDVIILPITTSPPRPGDTVIDFRRTKNVFAVWTPPGGHGSSLNLRNPEPLLASANLGDVTFAVLCRDGKRADVIRRVLQRIKEAPTSERPDVIAKLSILADLRNIGAQVKAEMERMGIPVNIEDSTLVRPVIERVREETLHASSIDSITRVLRSRFDRLPDDLAAKLENLSQDELNQILDRAGTAESIETALATGAPAVKP